MFGTTGQVSYIELFFYGFKTHTCAHNVHAYTRVRGGVVPVRYEKLTGVSGQDSGQEVVDLLPQNAQRRGLRGAHF